MTTQITKQTELQAINQMLSVIGEAPVNSIQGNTSVDVSVAKNILDETSLNVQAEGHHFNSQYDFKLNKTSDGKVPLPSNTANVDASQQYRAIFDVTMRGGFLFNLNNNSDVFEEVPTVDIVLIQNFEDLPQYARNYITVKASRRFASRYLGSGEVVKLITQDEQEALITFKQSDTRNADVNILEGDINIFNTAFRTNRKTY